MKPKAYPDLTEFRPEYGSEDDSDRQTRQREKIAALESVETALEKKIEKRKIPCRHYQFGTGKCKVRRCPFRHSRHRYNAESDSDEPDIQDEPDEDKREKIGRERIRARNARSAAKRVLIARRDRQRQLDQFGPQFGLQHGPKSLNPSLITEFHLAFKESGVYVQFDLENKAHFNVFRVLYQPDEPRIEVERKSCDYTDGKGGEDPGDQEYVPTPVVDPTNESDVQTGSENESEGENDPEREIQNYQSFVNRRSMCLDSDGKAMFDPDAEHHGDRADHSALLFFHRPPTSRQGVWSIKNVDIGRSDHERSESYYLPSWKDLGVSLKERPAPKSIDSQSDLDSVYYDAIEFAAALMKPPPPLLASFETVCEESTATAPMSGETTRRQRSVNHGKPVYFLIDDDVDVETDKFQTFGHCYHLVQNADFAFRYLTKIDPYNPLELWDDYCPFPYVFVPFANNHKPVTQKHWRDLFHTTMVSLNNPLHSVVGICNIVAEYVLILRWESYYASWLKRFCP